MAKNVMVDLETWGLDKHAMIISIGAVMFDDKPFSLRSADVEPQVDTDGRELSFYPGKSFHIGVDPSTWAQFKGGKIDGGTVMWWNAPERAEALERWRQLPKVDIASMLSAFIMWLNPTKPDDYLIWGNGITFDNLILANAYEDVLGPGTLPWTYRCDMDYRTMAMIGKQLDVEKPPIEGVVHDALSDAVWQARYLQAIAQRIGFTL